MTWPRWPIISAERTSQQARIRPAKQSRPRTNQIADLERSRWQALALCAQISWRYARWIRTGSDLAAFMSTTGSVASARACGRGGAATAGAGRGA
jgi:hypothetical protein